VKNHFSKEKREKKKAFQKGGVAKKPKGNGISAEGWQGIKNNIGEADHIALPLCRSLLAFLLCVSLVQAAYFRDLFFPYFILIEKSIHLYSKRQLNVGFVFNYFYEIHSSISEAQTEFCICIQAG